MTNERKLEIAMKSLKHIMRERGVHLTQNSARELGNAAKSMQIPIEELKEFFRPLIQELINEQFGSSARVVPPCGT